jgi:hypothetical protein
VQIALGRHSTAAGNLARAVQQSPNQQVSHTNMDVVLGTHIMRAHWVLYFMWFVLRHAVGTASDGPWVPVVLSVTGASLIGAMAWSLHRSIGASVPAFLRGFVRREKLFTAWAGCILVALLLFVVAAFVPQASASILEMYAAAPLLLGVALSVIRRFRRRHGR